MRRLEGVWADAIGQEGLPARLMQIAAKATKHLEVRSPKLKSQIAVAPTQGLAQCSGGQGSADSPAAGLDRCGDPQLKEFTGPAAESAKGLGARARMLLLRLDIVAAAAELVDPHLKVSGGSEGGQALDFSLLPGEKAYMCFLRG
eukprot:scaffold47658_cov24-Prasinocladus_malaysianus.AAC.1